MVNYKRATLEFVKIMRFRLKIPRNIIDLICKNYTEVDYRLHTAAYVWRFNCFFIRSFYCDPSKLDTLVRPLFNDKNGWCERNLEMYYRGTRKVIEFTNEKTKSRCRVFLDYNDRHLSITQ